MRVGSIGPPEQCMDNVTRTPEWADLPIFTQMGGVDFE
jgi:hypothetical protein